MRMNDGIGRRICKYKSKGKGIASEARFEIERYNGVVGEEFGG